MYYSTIKTIKTIFTSKYVYIAQKGIHSGCPFVLFIIAINDAIFYHYPYFQVHE